MSASYQKNNDLKKSGIEWIGNIPRDWDVLPVRAILKERKEKNRNGNTDNILSVMKDVGVIRYDDKGNVGNKSSDRPEGYKIVHKGDIVINSMNLVIGSVGIAGEDGVTSSVYIIYKTKKKEDDVRYFFNLFRDKSFQKHLGTFGKGIMELRESIKTQDIKIQQIPIPPVWLQNKISDFLEKKLYKLDQINYKKQLLAELLKEMRISLISRATTRGINYHKKFKKTKSVWLKEIPCDWKSSKLRFLATFNPGKSEVAEIKDEMVSFLPMPLVSDDGQIDLSEDKNINSVFSGYTYFADNDVIIAKITPCFENGKGAVLRNLTNGIAFGSTEFHVLRTSKLDPDYLYYVTMSHAFRKIGELEMRGSAGQQRVPIDFVKDFVCAYPDINKQKEIVNILNQKIENINQSINKIQDQIRKLTEYRSSLIYNAVTGKIKI